jgi:DNA-binding MarR family transcriptional regulator
MLDEADLRILDALHAPKSVSELADATEYSPGYVSERVAHLAEAGLAVTERENRAKVVRAPRTRVLDAYRDLVAAHPHVDLPSLLSPSTLRVCWFLDTPTRVRYLASRLTLKRRRIYQLLDTLQSRGLLVERDGSYVLPDDFVDLARFAQVVVDYEHQHRADSIHPTAAVVWSAPHEALVASTGDPDAVVDTFEDRENWHLTGLPRFEEYGLEFFTAGAPPYFYSELAESLTAADVIVHTLALDADSRRLSYCALLLHVADVPPDEARTAAACYGVEESVDALVTFLESNGEAVADGIELPDWSEMTALADQYGVAL